MKKQYLSPDCEAVCFGTRVSILQASTNGDGDGFIDVDIILDPSSVPMLI